MSDSRRREILTAAERLFRHYGPGKTTVADIAREVRIGVGSVYLEFPSKEAILSALSRQRHARILDRLRERSREGRFSERLAGFFAARVDALYDLQAEGAHACDFLVCPSSGVQLETYLKGETGLLLQLLAEVRDGGELASDDLDAEARLIQRAFASFAPPLLFELPQEEAREQASQLARWLVLGVGREDVGA